MLRSATESPTAPGADGQWAVVVPAKSLDRAKSRMTAELSDPARRLLVRAMLLDVIEVNHRCPLVGVVAVVTSDHELAVLASDAGARVLSEKDEQLSCPSVVSGGDQTFRYAAAIGLSWARTRTRYRHVAVLASDLPGITDSELTSALSEAERCERGFVSDADGTGTTMATFATSGDIAADDLRTFFGTDSARNFAESGAHDLVADERWYGLRRDVDSVVHLGSITDLGQQTRRVVDSWRADAPGAHGPRSLGKMEE